MAGFQFSPNGVIPIQPEGSFDATAMHGAGVTLAGEAAPYDPEAIPDEPPAPRVAFAQQSLALPGLRPGAPRVAPTAAVTTAAAPAITPRTVIKAARARLKEIKAELKRHEALKKEHAQLERMLAAAGKPSASLTQINSRRAG